MVRGFDLDGVICAFHKAFHELIEQQTGIKVRPISDTYPDKWDYDREIGMSDAEFKAVWEHVAETDFWETLEPTVDGAKALALIREGRSEGDQVYFITSRPGTYAKHLTEFWLDAQGYECPTVLMANKKGPVCQGLGIELFVDDKPQNCWEVAAACPKAQVFLLDAPYNRGTDATWCEHGNITRIHSILDPRLYAQETALVAAA